MMHVQAVRAALAACAVGLASFAGEEAQTLRLSGLEGERLVLTLAGIASFGRVAVAVAPRPAPVKPQPDPAA